MAFRMMAARLGPTPDETPEGNELYRRLLAFVPKAKQDKLQRFRSRQDALRSLTGELLVRSMAAEALGIPRSSVVLQTNAYGKPYLAAFPAFHFNVTHAGSWVVCAAGSAALGVDVERESPFDASLPSVVMTEAERRIFDEASEEDRIGIFYRCWTAKESFVKQLGTGLSTDPLTITVTDLHGDSEIRWNGGIQPCRIYRWRLDDEHPLAVCSEEPPAADPLQCVEASSWLAEYASAVR
ncbi:MULTISPECIES: 4'-phosphopantetheinyl transferase family protein [Paenibacillus]|uniref:4'-phosphopantetheinyl transferase family protein n=1 Tax=Paenibacillus TaxID=44249 RepID=UPI0022B8F86E|nr:4'-phosphopantetheinyl transferase superfamily protein [Paenibacillus caseinilyticus]MCZ8521746.1 4'-phosphopantetheinyl transferase superfamily protein [Paenibacillus caseinilyticus]